MRELKLIVKTASYTVLALTAYLILTLAMNALLYKLISAGLLPEFVKDIPVLIILIGLIAFLPKKFLCWPGSLEFKSARLIKAPAKNIWQAIYPQDQGKPYQSVIKSIAKIQSPHPENLGRFRYHIIDALHKDGVPTYYDLDIVKARPFHELVLRTVNTEDLPHFGKSSTGSKWDLIEQDNGTWVHTTEYQNKPSLFALALFLFISPLRDGLKQLAAHCEGRDNDSWMARQTRSAIAAHNSPSGLAGRERMLSDQTIIIGTVCVSAALFLGAIIFVLHRVVSPLM